MTEPQEDSVQDSAGAELHPGPRDEGGEGGMATRELQAREAAED